MCEVINGIISYSSQPSVRDEGPETQRGATTCLRSHAHLGQIKQELGNLGS